MDFDPYANPLAFFAAEMKRLRARDERTQEALADVVGFAPSTIAAVETCRLLPSEQFSQQLDKAFATDGHFERLQKLVEKTCIRPWFSDLYKVERRAAEIRTYTTYVIPGLLQTEDYARCTVLPARPELMAATVERTVALRMARQKILERPDPPRLWAVIDESALLRVNGGPDVMAAQRDHLLAMSQRPNIVVQVIPNAEGLTAAFGRQFTILSFTSEPAVVYLEDLNSARYLRRPDEVSPYTLTFDHLRGSALRDDKSRALIRGNDVAMA